jgi:polyhydroxyalkanoate synthesis regulator phasin
MAASKSSNRSRESSAAGRNRSKPGSGNRTPSTSTRAPAAKRTTGAVAEGLSSLAEQLANRIIKPLGLVVLSRERIQETLDEAAERGRLTRSDANELVSVLVERGRQQTDELLFDLERLLGRGRQQLDTATRRARRSEPLDRLVRGADRARRTVGVGPSFPIIGYDDLTSGQVQIRLGNLSHVELRKVREYERAHANRKSVLATIDKLLG